MALNNRNLVLTVLEAEMSKIKVLVNLDPDENSIPALWMATFLLYHHMIFPLYIMQMGGETER